MRLNNQIVADAIGSAWKPCCPGFGTMGMSTIHSPGCPWLAELALKRAPLTMAEEIARAVPWALIEEREEWRAILHRVEVALATAMLCRT